MTETVNPLEVMRLQAQIASLRREKAQLEEKFRALTEASRSHYPGGPVRCVVCGAATERPRRWMCPRCYSRWYRRQRPRPLGGMVA